MSCSDILLSFLADAGEDWAESFIFPEADGSIDVTDYLNKSDYVELERPVSPASCSSEEQLVSEEDDRDFQDALDAFEFTEDEFAAGDYLPFGLDSMQMMPSEAPTSSGSKRKACEEFSEPVSKKASKLTPEEKIVNVVGLLQKYRVQRGIELAIEQKNATRRHRYSNPIGTAESYLQAILGSSPATPIDLMKLSSPSASLQSQSLASLVAQVQSQKAHMKLSAWMPVSQAISVFPETHNGVGQTAAASRGFASAMTDMISMPVMQNLKFSVSIPQGSAIISAYGDQLSAPFVWRSEGMVAMGYPEELEFNGLIRCSFVKEGVSAASVSFDACRLVRQTQMMFKSL